MKIAMYDAAGLRLPDLDIPDDVVAASVTLAHWIVQQPNPESVSLNGMGRVVDRDARTAELEAALIHEYNEEWDVGDGITDEAKVQFLIDRIPK